jgi:hypothetical protein
MSIGIRRRRLLQWNSVLVREFEVKSRDEKSNDDILFQLRELIIIVSNSLRIDKNVAYSHSKTRMPSSTPSKV